jgi:hypothetical protein
MVARALNAMIGFGLFLSPFLWPHSAFQRLNAWVVGMAAVTAALAAARGLRWARYVNVALGAWLILSALLPLGQRSATVWTHLIAGFGLVLFGLVRSMGQLREHPGQAS